MTGLWHAVSLRPKVIQETLASVFGARLFVILVLVSFLTAQQKAMEVPARIIRVDSHDVAARLILALRGREG